MEFSVFSVELVRVEVSVVVVVVLLLGSSDVEGDTEDVAGGDASEEGAFDGVSSEEGASVGDPSEGGSSEVELLIESLSAWTKKVLMYLTVGYFEGMK